MPKQERRKRGQVVEVDGVRIEVLPPDLDQDGKVGGVEKITQKWGDDGTQDIVQPTELGDVMKEVFQDEVDQETRMSSIDMRSNLHPLEISSVLAMDALVALRVLPTKCLSFTRLKKRLAVSENARGREDIVRITQGSREHDERSAGGSIWEKTKNALGGGKK